MKRANAVTVIVVTIAAAIILTSCNEVEQKLRAREGWPTPTPNNAPRETNVASTAQSPDDLQFIDKMTAHHQQAVQMAQLATDRAQHAELKTMAHYMLDANLKEIDYMRSWRERWFPNRPLSGTERGQQRQAASGPAGSIDLDMGRIQAATGGDFDMLFLDMMIQHHQGAIEMSRDALAKAEHQEIKQLAQRIIDEQQKEIDQMNQWRESWKGKL